MEEDARRRFDAFLSRIDVLSSLGSSSPSVEVAEELETELYADMEAPYLNSRWQDLVVREIRNVATHPEAGPEVVDALRQTLLSYASQGGGGSSPATQAWLAESLAAVGGPEHPECDQKAIELLERAQDFADLLGSSTYRSLVERTSRKTQDVIRASNQKWSGELADAPMEARAAWTAFDSALRVLRLNENLTAAQIQKAANLAGSARLSPRLRADATSRLLLAFRMILEDRKRESKEVVQAIDARLLGLAKGSRQLTSKEHWDLWAEAVGALQNRASRDLERFVHDTHKRPPNEVIERAMKIALGGLKQRG